MEDQITAGLLILDGGARVRKSNPPSLVKLEDLGGSGADLTNYSTKSETYNQSEVKFRLAFKQHVLDYRSGVDRRSLRPIW